MPINKILIEADMFYSKAFIKLSASAIRTLMRCMQKFIATTGKTMQPWQLGLQDYLESVKTRLYNLT